MAHSGFRPFAPVEAYADIFERYGRSSIPAPDSPGYEPASIDELKNALAHVSTSSKPWAQVLDLKELEFLFNRSRRGWEQAEDLHIHVQQTVRDRFPERNRASMLKCHGYTAGIMWIFLGRRHTRGRADDAKRKAGVKVPERMKQTTKPVDKKNPPQRLLL